MPHAFSVLHQVWILLYSAELECFDHCSFLSSASVNVLVQNCKIYNDASCDISADGQLLAAFIPSSQRGFPDEGILAVYSLAPHNLGEMLYTKRFGKMQQEVRVGGDVRSYLRTQPSVRNTMVWMSMPVYCSNRKYNIGCPTSHRYSIAGGSLWYVWIFKVLVVGSCCKTIFYLKNFVVLERGYLQQCLYKIYTHAGLLVLLCLLQEWALYALHYWNARMLEEETVGKICWEGCQPLSEVTTVVFYRA